MNKKSQRVTKDSKPKVGLFDFQSRLANKPIKQNRLSTIRLVIFVAIFAFIGSHTLYRGFAFEPNYSRKDLGAITGIVSSSKNKPLAGAMVTVTVDGLKRTYTTSSTGRYYIPELPASNHSLSISATGHSTITVQASSANSKIITKNITLEAP